MQFLRSLLFGFLLSIVLAQDIESSTTSSAETSNAGEKTRDFCRYGPDCSLSLDRLGQCNDTELDITSMEQSKAFQSCLCQNENPPTDKPFNRTWMDCLQCWINEFAVDQDVRTRSQTYFNLYCNENMPNSSWFLQFKWIVLVAGYPKWAIWEKPSREPDIWPGEETLSLITRTATTFTVGGFTHTSNGTTITQFFSTDNDGITVATYFSTASTSTSTSDMTTGAAPTSHEVTATSTATDNSITATATASATSSEARRLMQFGPWLSSFLYLAFMLSQAVLIWALVRL